MEFGGAVAGVGAVDVAVSPPPTQTGMGAPTVDLWQREVHLVAQYVCNTVVKHFTYTVQITTPRTRRTELGVGRCGVAVGLWGRPRSVLKI